MPLIKVKRSGERLWVQTTEDLGGAYRGTIDSNPFSKQLNLGDEIIVQKKDIIEVWKD